MKTNYDFTKLSDIEFVPATILGRTTLIPPAYEWFRSIADDELGEITDRQWEVIEMLVALHDALRQRQ